MALPTLTTERLVIRPWDPDDAKDVSAAYDIYRRPEVARWLGSRPEPWASEEIARQRLLRWQSVGDDGSGFGLWALVPRDTKTPVGTVLLVQLPDAEGEATDDVEIGWHLHPEHWGKGYATEAAVRLLAYAREELGVRQVNAVAYDGNDPSFAVMRRLGMSPRGTTDRWYGVQLQWWSTAAPST